MAEYNLRLLTDAAPLDVVDMDGPNEGGE